jgi:hypothetical protein
MIKFLAGAAILVAICVVLKHHPVNIGGFSSESLVEPATLAGQPGARQNPASSGDGNPSGQAQEPAEKPAAVDIAYTDIEGKKGRLGRSGKLTITAFWVGNCPYSSHALTLLAALRKRFYAEQLDIVAFYLNKATPEQLKKMVAPHHYGIGIVATQPPVTMVQSLLKSFQIGMPGRKLFIVDGAGAVREVDIGNLKEPQSSVMKRLDAALGVEPQDGDKNK